jgi:hypothetical protein
MTAHDDNETFKPVPSWFAAALIVAAAVSFLTGTYFLLINLVALVGEGLVP